MLFKVNSYRGVVASHGPSGLPEAAGRVRGVEPASLKGRDKVGGQCLLICPEMRGSARRREEETRRPLSRAPHSRVSQRSEVAISTRSGVSDRIEQTSHGVCVCVSDSVSG